MNTGYTPVQGRGFVRPEKQNLQNFAEIIPVISGVIGGRETTIVSASAFRSVTPGTESPYHRCQLL
ncbi:phage antirepressor [Escherichia coli]|nr:phage antirepressor [Escherichia coli]